MALAVFMIMVAVTVAGITYPLLRREGLSGMVPVRVTSGRVPDGDVCAACGRMLEDDELFCPGCGTKRGGGDR